MATNLIKIYLLRYLSASIQLKYLANHFILVLNVLLTEIKIKKYNQFNETGTNMMVGHVIYSVCVNGNLKTHIKKLKLMSESEVVNQLMDNEEVKNIIFR